MALLGTHYPIVVQGQTLDGNGTSRSAPAWAALSSQINDYRASLGKPTLGFLNPRLYNDPAVRAALVDVKKGSNPGCSTPGFPAVDGWDPVTGLGSMNFTALRLTLGS